MLTASQQRIPWFIWCSVLAVTSAVAGANWDISWHRSIGRDTFWTPAHMAIQLCGVLAGVAFGYLILFTTFRQDAPLRPSSVRIWGFRGPLGAFIASWGGIAMLTSAPFDNWWHSAYGLDVKIVSPPHIVLLVGTYAVMFGTIILIAGHINRAVGPARRTAQTLFVFVCGITLTMLMVLCEQYTQRPNLHTSEPYVAMAILLPFILGIASRGSGRRFAATTAAAIYMGGIMFFIWFLPLFPAEPKLGPVFQHVTHFIPPQFPMLIIVPALLLDLFWNRARSWNLWGTAAVSAALFVVALVAAEWPFAHFLMSPGARNGFFGTNYLSYLTSPNSYQARYLFYDAEPASALMRGLLIALVGAFLSFAFGLSRGSWIRSVKR